MKKQNFKKIVLCLCCMSFIILAEAQVPVAGKPPATKLIDSIQVNSLADFAPQLYQSSLSQISELRLSEEGKSVLSPARYKADYYKLQQMAKTAGKIKDIMLNNYATRNVLLRSVSIQQFAPAEMAEAEKKYRQALASGQQNKFDSLNLYNNALTARYAKILNKYFSASRLQQATMQLNNYQQALQADLKTLQSTANGSRLLTEKIGTMERLASPFQRPVITTGINTNYQPPYFPPVGNSELPAASSAIGVEKIYSDSVRLSFYDLSDNETGNRIWRSDDLLNWQVITNLGPIDKFEEYFYTDKTLTPDKQYAYKIETYNDKGSAFSQLAFLYTKNNDAVKIWRIQLYIKIADINNAGLDAPISVSFANNSDLRATSTIIDYSIKDFQRNSEYTYDLGFANLESLSDIENITITNTSENDECYVEGILLKIDQQVVYEQTYGTTTSSAYHLFAGHQGAIVLTHDMLRNSTGWSALYRSQTTPLPGIALVTPDSVQVVIKAAQIQSMVESVIGNLLHTDLKGILKWKDEGKQSTVLLTRAGANTYHVHLSLKTIISTWPDPDTNIDFDLVISKSCDGQSLKINIGLTNFKTSVDSGFWADLKTIGFSELTDEIVQYIANNCTPVPVISQSIQTTLPDNIDCSQLTVSISAEDDLVICCFKP